MNSGEATARSILDKPLRELTEEDIAQLTREDCRRYLKEKGMRRPSWNKSQAIQQVISLKALLEPQPADVDAGDPAISPKRPPSPIPMAPKEPASDSLGNEPSPPPCRRADPIAPAFTDGEAPPRPQLTGRDGIQPETACHVTRAVPREHLPTEEPEGQMTIFYDGKVNVYEGVPPDKARVIMQLAASRDDHNVPTGPVQSDLPVPFRPQLRPGPLPPSTAILPTFTTGTLPSNFRENAEEWRAAREVDLPECPTSRKASLQRYLEKRKDRFKGKRILGGLSSNMEMMYASQRFKNPVPVEQSGRNDMSSPRQPRPPGTPARCSSSENRNQKPHISFDLNDDDQRIWMQNSRIHNQVVTPLNLGKEVSDEDAMGVARPQENLGKMMQFVSLMTMRGGLSGSLRCPILSGDMAWHSPLCIDWPKK